MSSKSDVKHKTDIANLRSSQIFQDWNEIEQFIVVRVGEPTADWYGVLWMEDVRGRRVVDNNGVF